MTDIEKGLIADAKRDDEQLLKEFQEYNAGNDACATVEKALNIAIQYTQERIRRAEKMLAEV